MSEPVWSRAAVARNFIQREPKAGEPATEPTEVRIYYTTNHLVIGARLDDSKAARIVATEYSRDAILEANDCFEVFLDTFHDRRNAFYFATNALGAQRDGLVRNEGETLNWEWDGVWRVASARTDRGWTTEIVIPFFTLRFRAGDNQPWGVNFGRIVARTREESYWAPISRDWGFFGKYRVSGYAQMSGLGRAQPGSRLQLKPYGLGGVVQDFDKGTGNAEAKIEFGLDAKVAISPTVMADLTLNTDFAQVEADQQQVNLTRFPLFFPEKRDFFLENAGLFFVGERIRQFEPPSTILFFSRRIGLTDDGDPVPLLGGGRFTGKLGRWDVGALDIVQDTFKIPEPDEGEPAQLPRTNLAAVRVKRDVARRSSVGAMFLSKTPADEGSSNQVLAGDTTIAVSETAMLSGFAAKSWTPGLTGSSHAAGIDLNWESDRHTIIGTVVDIGDDFNSEMGFVQRTGVRKYRGAAGLTRRPKIPGVRQLFLFEDFTYIEDRQGTLQTRTQFLGSGTILHNGGFGLGGWQNTTEGLSEPFEIRDGVFIPVGAYQFNQAIGLFESDRSRAVSGSGQFAFGGFYDGRLSSSTLGIRFRPRGRLLLDLQYNRNDVNLPVKGGDFITNLAIFRCSFAFSTHAFIRGLFQISDDDREARLNVLFRYTYRPGSDLFVVYNEDRGIRGNHPPLKRRELLIKATFHWLPFR